MYYLSDMETQTNGNMELKDLQVGDLFTFNSNSDVYEVLENDGLHAQVENKYTDKVSTLKTYTKKGGGFHNRKVTKQRFY